MLSVVIGTIVSAATVVAKTLSLIGLAVEGLKVLGNALMGIAKAFGLIKEETKVDELGDKALQAEEEGIIPENFDTYEAYVRAVEEYDLDPEKSKKIKEEDKVQKGIELVSGVTIEKFPEAPIREFFEFAGTRTEYFTEERMFEFGELMKEDEGTLKSVLEYMNGVEKDDLEMEKAVDILAEIEKKVDPDVI